VIDGSEGPIREGDVQTEIAEHPEGLGAGNLVNQVGANEKLSGAVGQYAYRMTIPNLLKKGLGHDEIKIIDPTQKRKPALQPLCLIGSVKLCVLQL
jgi:hypothetical protein